MTDKPTEQRTRMRKLIDLVSPTTETDPQMLALREYSRPRSMEDPFKGHYDADSSSANHLIEPDYSFYALMQLPNDNSMLRQCIDAMVTNIDGHGHRFMYVGPEGEDDSDAAKAERETLEQLFQQPNEDYSFQELRERLRRDFETIGNSYMEVARDGRGRIVMLAHVPAHTIRMTQRDREPTSVTVKLVRDGRKTHKISKRFRRYVQLVGSKRVYFKEFGDPRRIDSTTGQENPRLSVSVGATELIHLSNYTPGAPYGKPRWFNNRVAALGGRQAELTNLDFFKENAIPAMVLMVAGGLLTDESLAALEAHFRQARGRSSMNRVAVIEAGGDPTTATDTGAIPVPKIELKPLQSERQGDALWQAYEQNNADKIRSSFRLPPIYVGLSADYTYATAKTSFEVAEGQVFGPERQKFDDMVNSKILSTLGAEFWVFRSQPPRISAREDIIKAISAFERVGALTPNVTIGLANEFFDLEIKMVEEAWGDYPFSIITSMVQTNQLKPSIFAELAKHMQDPALVGNPNNLGEQPDGEEPAEPGEDDAGTPDE